MAVPCTLVEKEDPAMLSIPIKHAAPALRGKPPGELPHGLITPPDVVRQLVAEQKQKFGPEVYTAEAEERALCEHTLQYFFDQLGHEVLYRQTPEGPEVLAVGDEERLAYTRDMPIEEQRKLKHWLP
jgi:hypothetical protein